MISTKSQLVNVAAAPESPRQMVEQLGGLVLANARRWRRLLLLQALGLAVAVPLGFLWLALALDNLVHLPVWGRLLAFAGFFGAAGWLSVSLVRRWRRFSLGDDQVALAIERQTPGGVQNRLINALQIGRSVNAAFGDALVQENYVRLQQTRLERAARLKPAAVRLGVAAIIVLVGVLFYGLQPAHFTNAATRILLPFAQIEPIYKTVLVVEAGKLDHGDVPILIHIRGERPSELTILRNIQGRRTSESIPVSGDTVSYTFKAVEQSFLYAVRGGDYTTPYYRIDVPALMLVRLVFRYPAYTNLPDRQVESSGGDIEAPAGTRAEASFVLDQPVETAALIVDRTGEPGQRQELTGRSPTEFTGEIVLGDGVSGYQLQVKQGDDVRRLGSFSIRVLADQPPKLRLTGLEKQTETALESVLPSKLTATDDYGLEKVGLFVRRPGVKGAEDWQPLIVWPGNRTQEFQQAHELNVAALGVAEGDRVEIAARAIDSDPLKAGQWTSGTVYRFLIGGEGVTLQLLYEQILRTEAEIKAAITAQQKLMDQAAQWLRKLEPGSGLRWDDAKNLESLAVAMKQQAGDQEKLRKSVGESARQMVEQAGNLRLSLGMLADTEMIRAARILETVASRDNPQVKRSTLADARLTQERIVRSLQEILEQYTSFRRDWELAHLVGFVKMLADRQGVLRDESKKLAALPAQALRQASAHRRQTKLIELSQLAQAGFAGLVERLNGIEPILGRAFGDAAGTLGSEELRGPMRQAADEVKVGRWTQAVKSQTTAADLLLNLHTRLKKAQAEAALRALAGLQEKAKSDVAAQKQIDKLKPGNADSFLDLKDKLKLEEIIHMREQAQKKAGADPELKPNDYLFPDTAMGILQQPDRGIRQEFDRLKLAETPGKTPSFPKQSDRKGNKVSPHIQEKFDDLVGKLLEEADEIQEKYETYNLNAAFNINEPGTVGKQAGDLNSTAASAATGNQKPPTTNVGGASRSGRRGARAHGMVIGDESINRRGRDKVQEGQERAGDQPGTIKERPSEDMQKDTATGIGGKKVESDDSKFSLNDAGKFTEEMAKRLDKPQAKYSIVERQDGKLDPRISDLLRDVNSRQEQMIERLKAIRKELRNLYLPTEHLDELMAELNANLQSLKERPSAEAFRMYNQALDQLRGTLRVFHQAHAGFQPSVAREQSIHGRVLDEPARQTYPGYEEAVKQYYQRLSAGK